MRYGDNVEDEWIALSLLVQLTRLYPNVIARAWDSDGEVTSSVIGSYTSPVAILFVSGVFDRSCRAFTIVAGTGDKRKSNIPSKWPLTHRSPAFLISPGMERGIYKLQMIAGTEILYSVSGYSRDQSFRSILAFAKGSRLFANLFYLRKWLAPPNPFIQVTLHLESKQEMFATLLLLQRYSKRFNSGVTLKLLLFFSCEFR